MTSLHAHFYVAFSLIHMNQQSKQVETTEKRATEYAVGRSEYRAFGEG